MDDCLDYVADAKEFGKEPGTDLHEGKITLPLIHALRHCTAPEREAVAEVLEKEEVGPADLKRVVELIAKYDGIGFTRTRARERIETAKDRLEIFLPCPERTALATVADYVVSRTR